MTSTTPQDFFVDVDAGTLFARRWDPDCLPNAASPLILMHDSLGCVDLWRDFPAQLSQNLGLGVIAYDRLGFGRSTPRQELPGPEFISEEAVLVFPALCQSLGIETFIVLGHSVGGSMALLSAAHAQQRCLGVVSISAPAFVEDRTMRGIREATEQFDRPEHFARLKRWHGEKAKWVLESWSQVWQSEAFANWSLAPYLPQVQCPVLVIHGDQDEFGSTQVPQAICEQVGGPSQLMIMAGVGHVPHREQPDVVVAVISRFLEASGVSTKRP